MFRPASTSNSYKTDRPSSIGTHHKVPQGEQYPHVVETQGDCPDWIEAHFKGKGCRLLKTLHRKGRIAEVDLRKALEYPTNRFMSGLGQADPTDNDALTECAAIS